MPKKLPEWTAKSYTPGHVHVNIDLIPQWQLDRLCKTIIEGTKRMIQEDERKQAEAVGANV